jgi:hypothetical protein
MPKKLTYQEVYDFIKSKGYELLSKEYINSKKQLEIKCRVCQKNYKQTLTNFTKGYYHPYCENEIYFSELCEKYFTITTNEPFFDGWDADIIIHSEKIAILWNGAWHYKQIIKKQSLQQVQSRDKIKMNIIKKYGYIPYIIKDMGKYNKKFVEQEFEIFILIIKGLKHD